MDPPGGRSLGSLRLARGFIVFREPSNSRIGPAFLGSLLRSSGPRDNLTRNLRVGGDLPKERA